MTLVGNLYNGMCDLIKSIDYQIYLTTREYSKIRRLGIVAFNFNSWNKKKKSFNCSGGHRGLFSSCTDASRDKM